MSVTFSAYSTDHGLVVPESLELNVSNVNGRFLLDTLGVVLDDPTDLYGTEDPTGFLGRVLVAEAVAPVDAGVPRHEVPTTGARWIEGGRREGYLHEKLAVLRSLADWAIANECLITFG